MDLSEDSNDSDAGSQSKNLKKQDDTRPKHPDSDREDRKDKYRDDRDKSTRDEDRDRVKRSRNDDKYKSNREENGEKEWHRTYREDDASREIYRSDREDKYRDKEHRSRDERVRDDKYRNKDDEDKYRDRERDRGRDYNRDKYRGRRSSSRDRRSRSPRRSEYKRRSRSGSRERGGKSGYSRRYDRGSARMGRIEKLGIDIKSSVIPQPAPEAPVDTNNRFYMPGITGRFTEQIQRRKLLWQKNKDSEIIEPTAGPVNKPTASSTTSSNPKTGKLWETTTFAQDQDGKVANKFKRLMGIRDNTADGIKPTSELIKKQEEMFSSMEAQYEVARTATHTMRGVGLGFGSFQR
ncbi:uncharacterized protein ZC262.2 isoform X2 [Agrilus planipennis]|nr:uncharacterized protein ZC262.2 isoform X2 [Agrilus planipennis]